MNVQFENEKKMKKTRRRRLQRSIHLKLRIAQNVNMETSSGRIIFL